MQSSTRILTALALATFAFSSVSCSTTKPSENFIIADYNKDGKLDVKEMDIFIAASFLTTYDTNGDKMVDFQEWKNVNPEADLAKFKAADKDKDGKIGEAEMLQVVRKNPTFGNLMQTIDTNGDGVASPSETAKFRDQVAL